MDEQHKVLEQCRERNTKILNFLAQQNAEDVTEFQTTVQMVQVVINRLLTGQKQINLDMMLLNKVFNTLGEYESTLEQYVSTGRLRRMLTSNRLRRRLEKINSDLHIQLKLFVDSLKKLNKPTDESAPKTKSKRHSSKEVSSEAGAPKARKKKKKTTPAATNGSGEESKTKKKRGKGKKTKKKGKRSSGEGYGGTFIVQLQQHNDNTRLYGLLPRIEEDTEEKEPYDSYAIRKDKEENSMQLSNRIISDSEGKIMWAGLFGEETFFVEWDRFLSSLSNVLGSEINPDDAVLLRHVLDNSSTGYVNMYKWSEFLKGFGPLPEVVVNLRQTLLAPWFHGFLSSREAELLLEEQPVGTFLIRFSRSSGGSFALAFVQAPRKVLHILIRSAKPDGFHIDEEETSGHKTFASLPDIIGHYHVYLSSPFVSDLPRESWFHGDVSAQESSEMLAGQPEGTFLIRFSSRSGCFAASYVAEGEIKHALIKGTPQGYQFDGEAEFFPTLPSLIEAYVATLKRPLPNGENNVANVLRKYAREYAPTPTVNIVGPKRDDHYGALPGGDW
eukprot:TRINITY_DN9358_c0_g1_i1.p1 TRINITY_DN9358_c0_g1~~TRINITY_DN9358_c0_g1_i1.p1  ORF type:complete len:557 (+),score=92.16 TRINITY_DN9358_c0_g1_i1:184-1854(+)